jgi:hypothetical protein
MKGTVWQVKTAVTLDSSSCCNSSHSAHSEEDYVFSYCIHSKSNSVAFNHGASKEEETARFFSTNDACTNGCIPLAQYKGDLQSDLVSP